MSFTDNAEASLLTFAAGAMDERLRVVAALREMADASTDHAFPEVLRRSILRELAEFFEKGGHR